MAPLLLELQWVLCTKFGGFLTFGSIEVGQPTIKDLLELSPHLYNAPFKSLGFEFDGVYLPFLVDNVSDFLNTTYSSPDFLHDSSQGECLGCCDEVNPIAKRPNDGKLTGYDVDFLGVIAAIEERQQGFYVSVFSLLILRKDYTRFEQKIISGSPLYGKLFVVMRTGGTGKALSYGGKEKGARIVVANHTYGEKMLLPKPKNLPGMILPNTTSVGMEPKINQISIPKVLES
ncbi:Bifunctional 3-dehydroquinate dehydratase/shikimate dehydrogenase, chloroplastic, partial [Mucuna pruriens]